MPKIHIDEQVMAELKRRANEQTPNDVIRQFLGLSPTEEPATEPGIYLIPHSPKEFPEGASGLARFLEYLAGERDGVYLVASAYYWRNVIPESICLFHKDKMIVGEGKLDGGLMPYHSSEVSPATGKLYAGEVHFVPASIMVYGRPIAFGEAETLLSTPLKPRTLNPRIVQRLTPKDYEIIHKAFSK